MVDVLDTLVSVNIFRYFIATFGILGNLFILYLFVKYAKLRESTSNLFVTLFCISDLFVGIGIYTKITFVIYADAHGYQTYNKIDCFWANFTQGLGIMGCQFVTFAIAADRFFAVYNPAGYLKSNGSYKYFIATIFGIVFTNIFINILPKLYLFENSQITVCASGASSGPYFSLVFGINNLVFGIAVFVLYIGTLYFLLRTRSTQNNKAIDAKFVKTQKKILISASLVLSSYTICYGFPSVLLAIQAFFKLPSSIAGYATTVMGFGTGINSCVDCVIFLIKYPDINEAATHFIRKKLKLAVKKDQTRTVTITSSTANSNVLFQKR